MIRTFAFSIFAVTFLTGCPGKTVRENELVNRWVYGIMEENYLWAGKMPGDWETGIESHPEIFFERLLFRVQGDLQASDQYSRIEYTGDEDHYPPKEGAEYGFEAVRYNFGMEIGVGRLPGVYFCHILMVTPGSPAGKAGLKRGECFNTVNGQQITSKGQIESLLANSTQIEIDILYPEEKKVKLRKEYYSDSPVHFDSIYTLPPVTGYLVYNHFTDGSANSYYNELRSIFARFLQAGVENIVLDLRYNGGGELSAARKVASLLAPPDCLGGIYIYKERNTSFGNPGLFESETLYTASQVAGYNCGNISLYVITGSNTASASELIIHCLRPLYENAGLKFIQAGKTTYGKNVGGTSYTSNRYEWEISPITLRVHNINKISGYEYGLQPDIASEEIHGPIQLASGGYVVPVGDWGDIQSELVLQDVMNDIYGYGGWVELIPKEEGRWPTAVPQATRIDQTLREHWTTLRTGSLTDERIVLH